MPAQLLYFYYIVVGVFILPFAFINLLILKVPIFSGIKPFVVTTGSMEPVVPTGSIIYTVHNKAYKKGDVIAFSSNNESISHRIVGLSKLGPSTYYSTKGDSNTLLDGDLVLPESVYGKIVMVISPALLLWGTIICSLMLLIGWAYRFQLVFVRKPSQV